MRLLGRDRRPVAVEQTRRRASSTAARTASTTIAARDSRAASGRDSGVLQQDLDGGDLAAARLCLGEDMIGDFLLWSYG